MKKLAIFSMIAVAIWFVFFKQPAPRSVVATMQIDATTHTIEYKQMKYEGNWSAEKNFSGDLRYISTISQKVMPILTHLAVVTTGEYSNPELVTIESRGDGIVFGSRKKPEGSIHILSLIPADITVYNALTNLKAENKVTIKGRMTQELITSDQGKLFAKGVLSDEHQAFVLVTSVQ